MGTSHNATTKLTSISYSSRLQWDSLVAGQWLEYDEIFWMKWTRRRAFMARGEDVKRACEVERYVYGGPYIYYYPAFYREFFGI